MKQLALVLLALAVMAGFGFAQTGVTSQESRINILVDDGLYRNYDAIAAEALGLTGDQQYRLYDNNEDEPIAPFAVNFFIGLGIGSFIQGDTTGGLTGIALGVIGVSVATLGYMVNMNAVLDAPYGESYPTEGVGIMLAGAGVSIVGRIYQLVRPFSYSSRYNRDLRRALGI